MGKKTYTSFSDKSQNLIRTNKGLNLISENKYHLFKKKYSMEFPGLTDKEIRDKIYRDKSNEINEYKNLINFLDFKEFDSVKKINELNIIKGLKNNTYSESIDLKDSLLKNTLGFKGFFEEFINYNEVIASNSQTPMEFLKKVTDLNEKVMHEYTNKKNSNSRNQIINSIKNFNKGDKFTVFDLETLAGENEYNIRTFGGITEYAFSTYSKGGENGLTQVNKHHGIIGIDEKTTSQILKEIDSYRNTDLDKIPAKVKVAMAAFGKMGHDNTNFSQVNNKPGIFSFDSYASDEDKGIYNINNIIKGAQRYNYIHKIQNESRTSQGIKTVEADLIEGIHSMQDNLAVGYNITNADIPWLNMQLENMSPEGKAYAKNRLGGLKVNMKGDNIVDVLSILKEYDSIDGKSVYDFYDGKDGILGFQDGQTRTAKQQSTLFNAVIGELNSKDAEGLAAHSAEYDVLSLATMVNNKDFMDKLSTSILENHNEIDSNKSLNANNMAFMTTTTDSSGKFYDQGPLSFTYDKSTGNIKTMFGHNIERDGARSEHQDFGRKKDSLIKIDKIGKFQPTEKFKAMTKGFADHQSIEEIYYIDMSNITNLEANKSANKNTVLMFDSEEKLEAHLSTLRLVGQKDESGKYKLMDGPIGDAIKQDYATISGKEGKLSINKLESFDDLIKISDNKIQASGGTRQLYNQSYSKSKKFQELHELMSERTGLKTISQSDAMDIMGIAKDVSNGKIVNKVSSKEVMSILGYTRGNEKILHDETLDNIISSWESLEAFMPINEAVTNYVDSRSDVNNYNKHDYYNEVLAGVMNEISTMAVEDKDVKKLMLTGKGETLDFAKNLNYIQIDANEIFKGSKATGSNVSIKDDLIKIDLDGNNPEFNLINSLIKKSGEETYIKEYNKETRVMSMLDKTVRHLHKNGFEDFIDLDNYYGSDGLITKDSNSMAAKLVEDIKNAKRVHTNNGNPFFQIKNYDPLSSELPTKGIIEQVVDSLNKEDGGIESVVNRVGKEIKSINTSIGQGSSKNAALVEAENIVKSTLFNEVDSNKAYEILKGFAFTDRSSKYVKKSLDRTSQRVTEEVATIISRGTKIGLDFSYGSNGEIVAGYNGREVNIELPKIVEGHGHIATRIGNMDVAYHSIIESTGFKEGDSRSKKIEMGSTITRAFNEVYNPSYGFDEDTDPLEALEKLSKFSKDLGAKLRDSSVVDGTNQSQRHNMFLVDYNGLVQALPTIYSEGGFEGAKFREKNFVEKILKDKELDVDRLTGKERELLPKDLPTAMKFLSENDNDYIKDPMVKEFLENLTFNVGEKHLSKNVGGIYNQAIMPGHYRGDNPQRPLIWQTARAQEFRRGHLAKVLVENDVDPKNMMIGDSITTAQMMAARQLKPKGMRDTLERAVTLKKLNLDPIRLRLTLGEALADMKDDNLEKGLEHALTSRQQKLADVWRVMSTHEDASISSKPLFDMYGYREKQRININEDSSLLLDDTVTGNKYLEQLKSMMPELTEDKDGKLKFAYGKNRLIEKEDVIYREAGLDKEEDTPYGSKMRLGFAGMKFTHKNTKLEATEEEVQDYLNKVLLEEPDLAGDKDKVLNRLKDNFGLSLIVEDAERSTYFKTLQNSGEKKMSYVPTFKVGEYDDRIDDYFEKNLKDTKAYKLKGKVPTKEALDRLIDPHFVPTEEFKTSEEFKDAIIEEQSTPVEMFFKDVLKNKVHFVATDNPNHDNKFMELTSHINLLAMEVAREEDVPLKEANRIMLNEMNQLGLNPFDIKDLKVEDGAIVLPTEVSSGESIMIDTLMEYAEVKGFGEKFINEDGEEVRKLRHYDDDLKAMITSVSVSKADDFDRGSYAAIREARYKKTGAMRARLKGELSKPRELRNTNLINSLKYQIKEKNKTSEFFNRHAKLSERELGLLKQTKVSKGTKELFQSKIDDGTWTVDEAKERIGHMFDFDENGISGIKEEYENKSVAKNIIENLQNRVYNKYHNTISLEDALSKDPEKYKHLKSTSEYFKSKGIYMDLKTAIEYDEMAQGMKSVDFNMSDDKDISKLEAEGFKTIDLLKMNTPSSDDADIIEARGDSYLTENLILDLGEEMEGVDKRYLAIPKINRRSGNEVVKYEHQKQLSTLQNRKFELDELYKEYDDDSQEIKLAKEKLMDAYDTVSESLNKDVYAKQGLIDNFVTIKSDGAYMGKTDTIVKIDLNDIKDGKIGSDETKERVDRILQSDIKSEDLNFSGLQKAMFDGKSLSEHAKEGNEIGASFLSEEAFEDMGFFGDDYLKKVSEAKGETVTREDMIEILQTDGITALTERYPAIDTDSIVPQNIYLDDNLHGNMIKITDTQQIAMGGDNDGDLQRSTILRDSSGRDSIISNLLGEVDNTFNEARAYHYQKTFGSTKQWRRMVDENLQKEYERSLDGGTLILTGNQELDKKLSSNVSQDMAYSHLDKHFDDWSKIEEDIIETFDDIKGEKDISLETLDSYLAGIEDPDKKAETFETMQTHLQLIQNDIAATAKYKKLSIGEANIPNYQIRRFADIKREENEWDDVDLFVVQTTAYENEQAVISAKKDIATYANTNRDYIEALDSAIRDNDPEKIRRWMGEHLDEEKLQQRVQMGVEAKILPEDFTTEDIMDLAAEKISSMDEAAKQDLDYLSRAGSASFGMSRYGLDKLYESIVDEDDSLEANIIRDVANTHEMDDKIKLGQKMADIETSTSLGKTPVSDFSFYDGGEESREQDLTSDLILNSLDSIHGSVMEAAQNLDGKTLALGALGLAAGTMAIGSIIGNPVRGYDANQEPAEGDLYSDASLADEDLHDFNGQRNGYVINVNASSRGSKREIRNAVTTAMASNSPADINISMNINDNTNQITQKYIQDMLAGSF